jgi:hypothetical protein
MFVKSVRFTLSNEPNKSKHQQKQRENRMNAYNKVGQGVPSLEDLMDQQRQARGSRAPQPGKRPEDDEEEEAPARPVRRPSPTGGSYTYKKTRTQTGAAGGLLLGVMMWYIGGLCFAYAMQRSHLVPADPVFGLWPWAAYLLISYVELVYLPRSLGGLHSHPWYIMVLTAFVTLLDIGGSSAGVADFVSNMNLRFSSLAIHLDPKDPVAIIVSLVLGAWVSLGAEPVTTYFWRELVGRR